MQFVCDEVDLERGINNNMRCFEMWWFVQTGKRLWLINNNMRCFEILAIKLLLYLTTLINNNMRCFEI